MTSTSMEEFPARELGRIWRAQVYPNNYTKCGVLEISLNRALADHHDLLVKVKVIKLVDKF